MADQFEVLIDEQAVARRIDEMGEELSNIVTGDWTVVQLLQGAAIFASDLMRTLAKRGVHPLLDSMWLESYRDAQSSSGRVVVRADLSRQVEGRPVLIVDEVFDSGRTIAFARAHLAAKGARETRACVFVRKPPALAEPIDHVGFDCPDRFLVGYGMDYAGRYRGLPFVGVLLQS